MTGPEISAARARLGMTLASFAFWLGLEGENGRRKIRSYESGKESPSGPIRRAISLALALKRLMAADLSLPNGGSEWDAAMDQAEAALGQRREPALGHRAGPAA